jgi:hypothetical protein
MECSPPASVWVLQRLSARAPLRSGYDGTYAFGCTPRVPAEAGRFIC